jgi:membrane associated rhomboid family serine protease
VIPLRDNIPSDRFPVVTLAIIAINIFVFLFLQHPTGFDSVKTEPIVEYGAVPYRITHPSKECVLALPGQPQEQLVCEGTTTFAEAAQAGVPAEKIAQPPAWLTIFTSVFMHGGWLHIGFNMLFLWVFGNNIEDAMGTVRYIAFYLLGGVVAALSQVAVSPDSTAPLVGASGAIAAVLGGYALLYPRARVLTVVFVFFIFLVEIPAMVMLGLWIFTQFLPAIGQLATPNGGGTAYFAHIGGFLFGLALVKLFATRRSAAYDAARYPGY